MDSGHPTAGEMAMSMADHQGHRTDRLYKMVLDMSQRIVDLELAVIELNRRLEAAENRRPGLPEVFG